MMFRYSQKHMRFLSLFCFSFLCFVLYYILLYCLSVCPSICHACGQWIAKVACKKLISVRRIFGIFYTDIHFSIDSPLIFLFSSLFSSSIHFSSLFSPPLLFSPLHFSPPLLFSPLLFISLLSSLLLFSFLLICSFLISLLSSFSLFSSSVHFSSPCLSCHILNGSWTVNPSQIAFPPLSFHLYLKR